MAAPSYSYAGASPVGANANDTLAGVSWLTGNVVLVLGMTEDNGITMTTPTITGGTGTGLTFAALSGVPTNTGSSCKGYAWSATAAGNGSGTVQSAVGSGAQGYFAVWVITSSGGLGTPATNVGSAKTVSVTRTTDNAAVMFICGDWSANADVTVTATPVTASTQRVASAPGNYTTFAFDWSDESTAGSSSYGIANSASTGTFTKVAVEVKGTGGGGGVTVKKLAAMGVG